MSERWASISASPSEDGEAAAIFRGYSLVKQQTQQPQLLLWLHIHTPINFHSSFGCADQMVQTSTAADWDSFQQPG